MIEACERQIMEFPLDMEAHEVAKELKREGWYAWATEYASLLPESACEQKRDLRNASNVYSSHSGRGCLALCTHRGESRAMSHSAAQFRDRVNVARSSCRLREPVSTIGSDESEAASPLVDRAPSNPESSIQSIATGPVELLITPSAARETRKRLP